MCRSIRCKVLLPIEPKPIIAIGVTNRACCGRSWWRICPPRLEQPRLSLGARTRTVADDFGDRVRVAAVWPPMGLNAPRRDVEATAGRT